MKTFGNRTASGAVSDFKRDPSPRLKRDSGLLFVVAIHPRRPPAGGARYSGEQTINCKGRLLGLYAVIPVFIGAINAVDRAVRVGIKSRITGFLQLRSKNIGGGRRLSIGIV